MIAKHSTQVPESPRIGVHKVPRRLSRGAAWPASLQRLIRLTFALLLLIVGVAVIATAIAARLEADASASWPTTSGRVTEATVKEGRESSSMGRGANRPYRVYTAHVRYEYAVDGRTYHGDRIGMDVDGSSYRSFAKAAAVTARYPAGATVTVHYDPGRPQRAVLEVGGSWGETVAVLLVGLILTGGGLLLLMLVRASRSRPTPA